MRWQVRKKEKLFFAQILCKHIMKFYFVPSGQSNILWPLEVINSIFSHHFAKLLRNYANVILKLCFVPCDRTNIMWYLAVLNSNCWSVELQETIFFLVFKVGFCPKNDCEFGFVELQQAIMTVAKEQYYEAINQKLNQYFSIPFCCNCCKPSEKLKRFFNKKKLALALVRYHKMMIQAIGIFWFSTFFWFWISIYMTKHFHIPNLNTENYFSQNLENKYFHFLFFSVTSNIKNINFWI